MATATKNAPKNAPKNRFANAPVVNLTVGPSGEKAPRVCVTTGIGFNDVKAIQSILELIQKDAPNTVVTNQGKWVGDQLVGNVAKNLGLVYEMTLPKFLEERNRTGVRRSERMTPEEDALIGFGELKKRLAQQCDELHVFGTPSGPQRGMIEAFEEVGKTEGAGIYRWGSAE